jgi:cell shape-determining protein MreC
MTLKKVKKGDRVITTGYGRTKDWGITIGTVSKRRGEKVFVVWDNTSFHIEDEMDIKEVRPYEKTKKSSNLVVD